MAKLLSQDREERGVKLERTHTLLSQKRVASSNFLLWAKRYAFWLRQQ
jgi:hypothetical protein